jgi:MscS family membrane protein
MEYSLWNQFAVGLGIVLLSWIVGRVVKMLLGTIVKKIVETTETDLDDRIADLLRRRVIGLSVTGGIVIAIREFSKAMRPEDLTETRLLAHAEALLFIILTIVVLRFVGQLLGVILRWYMDGLSGKPASNMTATVGPLANKALNIVLLLVGAMVVFDHFDINVGSLLISLGVGSLAVALAAQDTLANMIAGFVIMVDRPFRVGDRVQLASGSMGDVAEIGLRSTRILDFDNNLIVVPNSELIKHPVVNLSYPEEAVRVTVEAGVRYGTDIDRAKMVMAETARRKPDIMREPIPEVFLVDLADSSIQLRLIARAADVRKRFRIEAQLREEILQAFQEEGIEIPFPQRVVHFVEPSDGTQGTATKKSVRRKGVQSRRR